MSNVKDILLLARVTGVAMASSKRDDATREMAEADRIEKDALDKAGISYFDIPADQVHADPSRTFALIRQDRNGTVDGKPWSRYWLEEELDEDSEVGHVFFGQGIGTEDEPEFRHEVLAHVRYLSTLTGGATRWVSVAS